MAKKTKNRMSVAAGSPTPSNQFVYPTNSASMMRIPKNVEVPAVIIEFMGFLTTFILYHQAHTKSVYHKAAMLVDCVSYDVPASYTNSKVKSKRLGWISIHFKKSTRMSTRKATFRNALQQIATFSNKPYGWSGIINKSVVPGCDSRICIGPRSKLYGAYDVVFSLGKGYLQTLISKF
jgi:hypothetical protein